ncbi:MAG: AarF/UbiB family protein [Bacteriovoracaceae bacterium]
MFKEGLSLLRLTKRFKQFIDSDNEESKKTAAHFINNLLDNEKGIYLKIGQVLGSKSGALDEFRVLTQSRQTAIELDVIVPYLEDIYRVEIATIFSEIDESIYPASIGQVHKGKLITGENVAIKIQYPHMKEKIKSQLKVLKLIPLVENVSPTKKWGVDLDSYYKMIEKTLEEELDYKKEIKNQKQYAQLNKDLTYLNISNIYEDISNDKVIVQSWEEGLFIHQIADLWSQKDRDLLGKNLLFIFFKNLLVDGFFQGDCNIGNYLFKKDPNGEPIITILDFGNCATFESKKGLALCRIILDTIDEEDIDPIAALSLIGFDKEKLFHIKDTLPLLLQVIFEPFKASFKYDLTKWNIKNKVEIILGEYKWWFRSAGDTIFFQVIKSFFGTVNLLEIIGAKVSWKRTFMEVISEIKSEALRVNYPVTREDYTSFKTLAKNLNVIIKENGKEKVNIKMPASVILDLEEYLDSEVLEKLKNKGHNIHEIKKNILLTGGLPQIVFKLEENNKSYLVQLV